MEFQDKMFAWANGLKVEEPDEHLSPGPSAPTAFEKFREKLELESYLGRPLRDEQQANFSLDELAKKFSGEPKITPQPGGDLHKRGRDFEPKDASGAVRFEEEVIGGNRWRHGFDAKGELISAYLLSSTE